MVSPSGSFLQNRVVLWLLRIAVGLVFILASISKLDQPEEFLDIIMAYSIVPWSPAIIMAVWLPWIELIVGFVLLLGVWVRGSALLLSALTIVFIVALTSALIRGLDFACGCFSVSDIAQTRSCRLRHPLSREYHSFRLRGPKPPFGGGLSGGASSPGCVG